MKRTARRRPRTSGGSTRAPTFERIERWAALAGRWTFDGPRAVFTGPDESGPGLPLGLAAAAPAFRDGRVRTKVRIARSSKTAAGIVVGFHSLTAPYVAAQVGAYERAYAISEYRPGVGWESLADAGRLSNLDPEVDHEVEVELAGQSFSMAVDQVPVLSALLRRPLEGAGMGLFAWGDAEVSFAETWVATAPPRIFVMMPFAEPYEALYRDVIKPIAEEELSFKIVRVDEIHAPGLILEDIQKQIADSHAVVAEISNRNPNVFYELGYAHALKKPAILLVRREESDKVPFDVKNYRAIFYDDSIAGKRAVETHLRAYLRAVKNLRANGG